MSFLFENLEFARSPTSAHINHPRVFSPLNNRFAIYSHDNESQHDCFTVRDEFLCYIKKKEKNRITKGVFARSNYSYLTVSEFYLLRNVPRARLDASETNRDKDSIPGVSLLVSPARRCKGNDTFPLH